MDDEDEVTIGDALAEDDLDYEAALEQATPAMAAEDLPESLRQAVLAGGWDPRHVTIAGGSVSPDGTAAVVALPTNEAPAVEPYEVTLHFTDGAWCEGSGANGPGMHWFGEGPDDPVSVSDWNGSAQTPGEVRMRVAWFSDSELPRRP
jgi:hypothetical protein